MPHYLYGRHACVAAMNNDDRIIHEVFATKQMESLVPDRLNKVKRVVEKKFFDQTFGKEIVHQGIAIKTDSLETYALDRLIEGAKNKVIMILDQVSDPHNMGAILRSCAAFDVCALVVHDHNACKETAVLAKTASGALELVPVVPVKNIAKTMQLLKDHNFWITGLAEEGEQSFSKLDMSGNVALVLGAEGKGLRRLVKDTCDTLCYLDTSSHFSTLNVSNAAAIVLHETYKSRKK